MSADAAGHTVVVACVEAKLQRATIAMSKAELVDFVTVLGKGVEILSDFFRLAADPPLA